MDIGSIGNTAGSVHSAVTTGNQTQPVQLKAVSTSAPVQIVDAVQQTATTPSLEQVKQAVQEINNSMRIQSHGLEFSIDDESDRTIVKVIDKQTEEVIKQIPSEETLAIAKSLDQMIGKLLQEKA